MRQARLCFAVLVAAVALAGCGGRGTVKVSGVVTLDGKPIEGAIVTFHPDGGDKAKFASGTADKDGNFQLTTTKPNDGAYPGDYKVAVIYAEGVVAAQSDNMKDAFASLDKQKGKKLPPPKFVVPKKYQEPGTSGIKQKVPTDGSVKLELVSK